MRKTKRLSWQSFAEVLVFILLIPFKVLKWALSDPNNSKYINSDGYVVLSDVNELEHRFIAKQILSRDLLKYEVVHHVNGQKTDNSITNLCLMNREKHEHFHSWLRWKKEKSGKYPTITKQKNILEEEYSGSLLEKLKTVKKIKEEQYKKSYTAEIKFDTSSQERLLIELKALRKQIALENKVPLYVVFNNKTLIEISNKRPSSERELLEIKGVGEVKLRQYGSRFLHEIKVFKKNVDNDSNQSSDSA